ncbi:hypothetical protein [Wenyingzhuangia aestuarii]|uniref:hypothetical protein n=1 Tax=Wenyingzhuangia aestuarii TaxID=1647582 RepID=UPI001439F6D2|nr:hypothetical protein [Wenyingzhuangia aestuarii]NJB82643.1 hypothetical protein [Wenyingzhuangia aestuarii]
MDIETSITVAVILFICITPFAMMHRSNKQKEANLLQSLKEIASQHNCNIHKHEFCNNYVIGLDSHKKQLFLFQKQRETNISRVVDLSNIQKCQVLKTNKSTGNKDLLEKIELGFIGTDQNKVVEKLEVYNEEYAELRGEYQLAQKWTSEINKILS